MTASVGGQALAYIKRMGLAIVARTTAPGGPVGIIRVSGQDLDFLKPVIGGDFPSAGTFELRGIRLASDRLIDKALVLFFKTPHSFSGENVIEIQGHGISTLMNAIEDEIVRLGASRALPGEFSFRAVFNNKMSLHDAELLQAAFASENLGASSLAYLVGARADGQSNLSDMFGELIHKLQQARARVEAAIDFSEAEEEQAGDVQSALATIENVKRSLAKVMSHYQNFSKQRHEARVVLLGAPNAGKSTLLNILCGAKKSIVSSLAGTTRDLVEGSVRLASGRGLLILDTAGLREVGLVEDNENHLIEKEGMELALLEAARADLIVVVKSAISEFDSVIPESLNHLPKIFINSHADLTSSERGENDFDLLSELDKVHSYLMDRLAVAFDDFDQTNLEEGAVVSARQKRLIEKASDEILLAGRCLEGQMPMELCGQYLQSSEKYLKSALGDGLGEEYIGEIFGQFCLGK